MKKAVTMLLVVLLLLSPASALVLPRYLQSHMVLQSEPQRACLWGWADPGATVELHLNNSRYLWNGSTTAAAGSGDWQVCLPPQPASEGGHSARVLISENRANGTANQEALDDLLFGHVYVCSGQSNMQATLPGVVNSTAECAAATNPTLRVFTVKPGGASTPQTDLIPLTNWSSATPLSICPPLSKPYTPYSLFGSGGTQKGYTGFSAVCYLFGRDLHAKLGGTTPVGLVHSSVGGTQVQSWMTSPPGGLWNAMVHPLVRTPIKGILWYQGESNTHDHPSYSANQNIMVSGWRLAFQQPNLPFLFVQIAPYNHGSFIDLAPPFYNESADGGQVPLLRLAQTAVLQLPYTGMACAIDLGDSVGMNNNPGHPRFKQPVAHRLVLEAMRVVYHTTTTSATTSVTGTVTGSSSITAVTRGPQIVSAVEVRHPDWNEDYRSGYLGNRRYRLQFSSVGEGGLDVRIPFTDNFAAVLGQRIDRSEVAGAANRTMLQATVVSGSVVKNSLEIDLVCSGLPVTQITGLFGDRPLCSVFNREGLPMEPFLYDL